MPNQQLRSVKLNAGTRYYVFDLERSDTWSFLSITESKRTEGGFERHRIVVHQEHFDEFLRQLELLLPRE
jgi:hypothetical protein